MYLTGNLGLSSHLMWAPNPVENQVRSHIHTGQTAIFRKKKIYMAMNEFPARDQSW